MNVAKNSSLAISQKTFSDIESNKTHSSEAVKEKKQTAIAISIVLLDHTEVVFNVNKRDRGQVLLDLVFQHLRVAETKFFGLQFPNDMPDTMRWLDPTKSIRKQFRRGYPNILFFRIKFYATDVSSIKDEFTKYQLFLQIKLDLLEKRLPCHISISSMIASYAVQSELGDYNPQEHKNNYISGMKFLPNQNKEFEIEVQRLHKLHKGLSPAQAETCAIKKAQKLELYGVEIHHAKDSYEEDLDVGVTSTGMLFYQKKLRIHQFKWSVIVKISFKRKLFYIQLRENLQNPQNFPEMVYSFHMDNYRACKRLWKSCVDFHSFYRINRCMNNSYMHKSMGNDAVAHTSLEGKSEKNLLGILTLGRKHKYKETDVYSNDDNVNHQQYLRKRTGSAKSKDNLVSLNEERQANEEKAPRRLSAPPSVSYGVGSSMISDEEMLEMLKNDAQNVASSNIKHTSDSHVASNLEETHTVVGSESYEVLPSPSAIPIVLQPPDPALSDTLRKLKVRSKVTGEFSDPGSSDASVLTYESDNSVLSSQTEKSYVVADGMSLPFAYQSSGNQGNGISEGLVIVRIKPDKDGRYGFNVKGGADQNILVTVSKVAENSPAALCSPPLNIGDHIVQINGRDISGHSHDQVVSFIKSTREHHSSQLVLLIFPAQDKPVLDQSETFMQPIPSVKASNRNSVVQDEGALLHNSMRWLEDMLDSGELLSSFESLYRKKPGSTMDDAKLPINVAKNRYRDISPYDNTRVHLQHGTSDYINANYVNMFIPGTDWVNSYVASQGPLLTTTADFWAMVWELQATFIVMLTTVIERGRPKCHQYWPADGTTIQFGSWLIESVFEEVTSSFAFRDFKLYNCTEKNGHELTEFRSIRQMQYLAWPDHGVPNDSSDFLDFILQVRQRRVGMKNACIVHCSAGIGRTGVLITMETAMCLIEANQPVYPLEITRTMRDQRAMMIQTPGQFKFVCEAILRVYKEGLAKPIASEDFDDSDQEPNSDDDNNNERSND